MKNVMKIRNIPPLKEDIVHVIIETPQGSRKIVLSQSGSLVQALFLAKQIVIIIDRQAPISYI